MKEKDLRSFVIILLAIIVGGIILYGLYRAEQATEQSIERARERAKDQAERKFFSPILNDALENARQAWLSLRQEEQADDSDIFDSDISDISWSEYIREYKKQKDALNDEKAYSLLRKEFDKKYRGKIVEWKGKVLKVYDGSVVLKMDGQDELLLDVPDMPDINEGDTLSFVAGLIKQGHPPRFGPLHPHVRQIEWPSSEKKEETEAEEIE